MKDTDPDISEQILQANQAESESSDSLRSQRQHAKENSKLKSQLALAKQKLQQAEAELEVAESKIDFIRALGEPDSVDYEFLPKPPSGQATAVIVLSDWHVEETVSAKTVNGLNEYDLVIAERRIKKTFENAVQLLESARHLSNIKDLVVAILGDMITGYIHEELQENNSLSPTEACLFVQDQIVSGIDFLEKHSGCKTITIPTAIGNHGRTTHKMRISTASQNSYEWMLYKQMEKYYKSRPKITWKVETGYHNWLNIQGKDVRFHHGDAILFSGGIGGPTVPILRALSVWDQSRRANLDVFGHLHTNIWHDKFLLNNCLIGYSPLAIKWKFPYSEPSQLFFVVDKKRATPVIVQKIFCE